MLLIMLYLQSPHKNEALQLPRGCLDKYTDAMLPRIGQVLAKAEHGSHISTASLEQASVMLGGVLCKTYIREGESLLFVDHEINMIGIFNDLFFFPGGVVCQCPGAGHQ